eukprot:CAMPEP_0118922080 /NCGR_PEP_ID=MMETSP1169-20130426/1132_1 /TAXON_ID=36882 /ORGANISM="Pyramimonas obovata, Strain CCMP722" /LENGTH=600 /DNA_ID=CAMNT_0006862899 /DNA_START=179 /DNA_END=1981 /DNA_ORIENTATION=-
MLSHALPHRAIHMGTHAHPSMRRAGSHTSTALGSCPMQLSLTSPLALLKGGGKVGTTGRTVQLVYATRTGRTRHGTRRQRVRSPPPEEPPLGYSTDLEERYEVGKILGAGGMGVVRVATYKETGVEYALKTMPKRKPGYGYGGNMTHVRLMKQEIEIQLLLGRSLNCVSLYEVFEDKDNVHLLMELMSGGSMLQRAPDEGLYSEATVATMARTILQTLAQCHSHKIVYRDIKPENYLYSSKDADASLKLSDFGLAVFHKDGQPPLKDRCGTVAYIAPEVLHRSYGEKADLWSAGVLIYQLLSGKHPFTDSEGLSKNSEEVFSAILSKEPDFTGEPWDSISPSAIDLIKALLRKDPSARVRAREALQFEWILEASRGSESKLSSSPLCGTVVARLQKFATQGTLRRAVYATIESYVDEERGSPTDSFHKLFDQLDHSRSGKLTADDLVQGLTEDYGYRMTEEEARALFTAMDIHRVGTVSYPEFAAALEDWNELEGDTRWKEWASIAFESFVQNSEEEGVEAEDKRIRIDAVAKQVCEADWKGAAGTRGTCVEEVKKTLDDASARRDGFIDLDEFTGVIHSSSDDGLSLYDARLPVEERED